MKLLIEPDTTRYEEGYFITGRDIHGKIVTIKISYDDAQELRECFEDEYLVYYAIGIRKGTIKKIGCLTIECSAGVEHITLEDCLPPELCIVNEEQSHEVFPIPEEMMDNVHEIMNDNQKKLSIISRLLNGFLSFLHLR